MLFEQRWLSSVPGGFGIGPTKSQTPQVGDRVGLSQPVIATRTVPSEIVP